MTDNQAYTASLEASIAKLVEALKPFARWADAYHSHDGQHDFEDDFEIALGAFKVTVGDLRRARQAIADQEGCGA